MIEGSKPGDIPGFIEPQLATLRADAPKGSGWMHEIKFDGYRMQAHVKGGRTTMYTRSGLNWTQRFSQISEELADLPIDKAIFDGEVVVEKGRRSNFSELQAELSAKSQSRLAFYIFDLLFLDGFDIRMSPQVERKRILKSLFVEAGAASPIFYSEDFDTDGEKMLAQACKLGLEGIISKDPAAPYRSGRNQSRYEIKCVQRGKFIVVGFVKEEGGGVAALHLAERNGKMLSYVGKVGTGFAETPRRRCAANWSRLRRQLPQ
jgi:bifunctional non-homologous end joining protein LigD